MKLVDQQVDNESSYLPLVQEYLMLLKDYEAPQKAAVGMTKQMGKIQQPKAKAKRQAKAKAAAS